ncbi:Uncharacterised protein [Bordetella ansorpii]|uniref:Lipoprotein n=1 Tax=Bordetella ansorpii TaxID=288768 RepID=A0A157SVT7_9BORD|nr:Uncharacterised protein [Bordetella ansorpii]
MPSRNLASLALLCASSMLTACGSSPQLPPAPMPSPQVVSLPAELAARCPPVVRPTENSDEARALALEAMYGLYGTCAARHVDTVDHINARHHP